ncbi:MAG: hypothetical protein H6Q90_3131 [Deltaproteobacteria bacterium]|nr:hypothetical protein [Deltaproteobacteria bacterium]
MRLIAVVLAAVTFGGGCAANSYQIPSSELRRLSMVPPETRGQRVRVIQELGGTEVAPAERVGPDTQIILIPNINFSPGPRHHRRGGGGIGKIGGGSGGSGSDNKAAAIAVIVLAAVALVAVAGIEGSRFDGYARLHPMHPVHLIGKDGQYAVMPLAWIDANTAAWTDKAVVRPTEGPWMQLDRAPLTRTGATYGMYAGTGTLRSAAGELGAGPAFTIQAGYFFNQQVGLMFDLMLGWRENTQLATLFESRYMAELQALPLQAGILHAGGYVGGGLAYRFEDSVNNGNNGSYALTGGGMLQLDINTRIALTARAGVTKAHEERMTDLIFGLSVY